MPMSAKLDPALVDNTGETLLHAIRDRAASTVNPDDLRQLAVAFERILTTSRTEATGSRGKIY